MVTGQKISLGRIHARQVVTVHVAAETITVDLDDQDSRTVRRTATRPVRNVKAAQCRVARGSASELHHCPAAAEDGLAAEGRYEP
jgi:hypothetical protein